MALRPMEERHTLTTRMLVMRACVVGVFVLLIGAFWFFQIIEHARFQEMAENNHQRELSLRAPRGVLFDRAGRVLVENRPSFNVSIVRLHTIDLDRTIRLLAAVAGVDETRLREVVDRHRREPSYRPIVVIEDASLGQVAAITARRLDFELPDVVVQACPTRQYPVDGLGAHLFGYVGEVTESQVASGTLQSGDIVGQAGIERAYNRVLMGQDGGAHRRRQQRGPRDGRARARATDRGPAHPADDRLRPAEGGRGRVQGARATTAQPSCSTRATGEVLAFTSLPAYDPNTFAAGIDRATWAALNTDELRPLQNRAIQGRYSPGSTFKIVRGHGGARGRASSRPTSRCTARAARPSTGASSSAG